MTAALLFALLACSDKDTTASGDTGAGDCEPAVELCDGADNDCDGTVDEEPTDGVEVYVDGDGDGYGDGDNVLGCADASGYAAEAGDCDDGNPSVHPGATEICDGADNDCDTLTDDEDDDLDTSSITPTYPDNDGDGYGDTASETLVCSPPPDHILDGNDCDDTDAWTYPGAAEVCDGKKTDCEDTAWLSDVGLASWYSDTDAAWTDLTATLSAGTETVPVSWTSDGDGVLNLCEATWYLDLTLDHAVQVVGKEGQDAVILSGGDAGSIVTITDDEASVIVNGLTLTQGLATHDLTLGDDTRTVGGAVWCTGKAVLSLDHVTLSDNTSTGYGGAVGVEGCNLSLSHVTGTGNAAYHGGFLVALESPVTVSDSHFEGNHADVEGGAFYLGGGVNLTVADTTFTGNDAYEGGAVRGEERGRAGSNTLGFTDSTLSANTATQGGALAADDGGDLTLEGCTFEGNLAYDKGGAVITDIRGATVTSCAFTDNEALDDGGAMSLVLELLSVEGSSFSGNLAEDGAALDLGADKSTITSSDFTDNAASRSGGAIAVRDADAGVEGTDLSFTGNSAERDGGAIYAADGAKLSLESCALTSNSSGRSGGAIGADVADVSLQDTSFTTNSAGTDRAGGAIWLENGNLGADAVTFEGNTATRGGAVALELGISNMASVTFTDNTADSGGGLWLSLSLLDVASGDFSGNTPDDTYVDDASDTDTWGTGASFACDLEGCE